MAMFKRENGMVVKVNASENVNKAINYIVEESKRGLNLQVAIDEAIKKFDVAQADVNYVIATANRLRGWK